jgi:hypothetical protein
VELLYCRYLRNNAKMPKDCSAMYKANQISEREISSDDSLVSTKLSRSCNILVNFLRVSVSVGYPVDIENCSLVRSGPLFFSLVERNPWGCRVCTNGGLISALVIVIIQVHHGTQIELCERYDAVPSSFGLMVLHSFSDMKHNVLYHFNMFR